MFNPRTLIALSVWAIAAVVCLFLPGDLRVLAAVPALLVLIAPMNVYQLCAKSVTSEPQMTDQKTLEFSPSRLSFIGPDWKNEMTWKRFNALSEDAEYFYLHRRHSNLAFLIPKSALTPEQPQLFRKYAGNQNP